MHLQTPRCGERPRLVRVVPIRGRIPQAVSVTVVVSGPGRDCERESRHYRQGQSGSHNPSLLPLRVAWVFGFPRSNLALLRRLLGYQMEL